MSDPSEVIDYVRANAFATLVTADDEGVPFATHLPLLLDAAPEGDWTLLGHVAKANPHWRYIEAGRPTLAIFTGDHAYISPSWYETQPAVPTWNYGAVHLTGTGALVEREELASIVTRLTRTYESTTGDAPYVVPDATRESQLGGIVGLRLKVARVEAKAKVGQNRTRADQLGALTQLESRGNDALAALTRRYLRE